MIVSLLAILKAGGAYVPLDPGFPAVRLEYMIGHSQMRLLLTQDSLLPQVTIMAKEKPRLQILSANGDQFIASLSLYSDSNPLRYASHSLAHLAYVLYTSGSTGTPKGVEVSHAAFRNFILAMQGQPGIEGDDVLLSVTSISFDIAGLEIFLPLSVGARLVLPHREVVQDTALLLDLIVKEKVTFMQATPAAWRALLGRPWPLMERDLKVLCGGEALSEKLAEELLDRTSEVWNMYGPTETTVWSTLRRLGKGEGKPSIGRPIANTDAYVLDACLKPAPRGVPGELYLGGQGLARGYLHRPDLTAERFVHANLPLPDGVVVRQRLYKTGDLVRYLPDGGLEYLGRIDDQVKIRGFRIELGEIESHLARHPLIKAVAVMAQPDSSGERHLVAYFVARAKYVQDAGHEGIDFDNLFRSYLQTLLPDYMIPNRYLLLATLPLTPNGKLDKRALPLPDSTTMQEDYIAPKTGSEKELAAIWSQLLSMNTDEIGRDSSFFSLGGDSLSVMKLSSAIEATFGVKISVKEIFENSNISSIGYIIDFLLGRKKLAEDMLAIPQDQLQSMEF